MRLRRCERGQRDCEALAVPAASYCVRRMVKKHIAPGGFPFAENAILEGLEGDEYMRRTIEEIQQSTAKMRAKRESSMAHEIAKIRMRQDAVAARRGPPPPTSARHRSTTPTRAAG